VPTRIGRPEIQKNVHFWVEQGIVPDIFRGLDQLIEIDAAIK